VSLRAFRFGIQLEHAEAGREWKDAARRAEAHGYSVLLMPDHFSRQWAPLVALTAAADATTNLRVGTLVADNDFRHPLALAKEAATLDLISDGRFELGIGAGWAAEDYHETGIPFDRAGVRVARLKEAISLIKQAWKGTPFTVEGEHYAVSGYSGAPRPRQSPGPPVLIGSGAPRLLAYAAQEADIIGICPRPLADGSGLRWGELSEAGVARKVEWVREAAGDRIGDIELNCNVFDVRLDGEVSDNPHALTGAVDEIADRLREWRARLGISYYAFLGDLEILETAAPIVELLAGT
jgi:probable F420-dependent oxidoreductase